jgi:hypothetical protein
MNGEEEGEHYRATNLHFVKSLLIAPGRAWWLWNPISQLATKWSKSIFGKINGFHTKWTNKNREWNAVKA